MHRALLQKASDILLDPKAQDAYEIRYRVDGLFRKPEQLDPELALAVVNCFKILSGMDIAERRRRPGRSVPGPQQRRPRTQFANRNRQHGLRREGRHPRAQQCGRPAPDRQNWVCRQSTCSNCGDFWPVRTG